MDEIFPIHEDLLNFEHIPESHTGKYLAAHIFKILRDFNIHTKLFCITTDNASNNDKMMKELSKRLRQKLPSNGMVLLIVFLVSHDDDDDDDDQGHEIDNTHDFEGVLQKVRTISKAANYPQS